MKVNQHNYEELRKILQADLGRKVTEQEAKKIGRWLLGFYSRLTKKE